MKRTATLILCLLTALSLCLPAAAETWWVTYEDDFQAVGELLVTWLPDDAAITFDGDLSDWAFCREYIVTPSNLASWIGGSDENPDPAMPKGFMISARFAADEDGMYFAFDITDDRVVRATDQVRYNGDAIQIGFDCDGNTAPNDRQGYWDRFTKCMFYTACLTGGDLPFALMRQECAPYDGLMYTDTEGGKSYGMRGASAETETGWCTEFFLSWDRLVTDGGDRIATKDGNLRWDSRTALRFAVMINYYNYDEPGGKNVWAAGTVVGRFNDDERHSPVNMWTPWDCGMKLVLYYDPTIMGDLHCERIVSGDIPCVTVDDSAVTTPAAADTLPETQPIVPVPPETLPPETLPPETLPPETVDETSPSGDTADAGCEALTACGALIVMITAAAALTLRVRKRR